jgi:hypothetical protein
VLNPATFPNKIEKINVEKMGCIKNQIGPKTVCLKLDLKSFKKKIFKRSPYISASLKIKIK